MRKKLKKEVLEFINSLHQAHEEIRGALFHHNNALAQNMLCECQEFAVSLGETIEASEGENHITVTYIEDYCEALFHAFEEMKQPSVQENKICKMLKKQLIRIENSVRNDIRIKKEVVFFPYKAAMWDSLESIYLAAKEDPECDAYCVPIPYFDLNPDSSMGKMHYEGGEYPEDIKITDWQEYPFEEREPDVVFIHNPYDDWNRVTSVHPRYYSANLKKYTDKLVYVPYYITSGGMTEGQSLCSAYLHADYIVVQAPKFIEYFDKSIGRQKFLPFGSPKADRVIHLCDNPSEPPAEWKKKMDGKKTYFYNTSIGGMLGNTRKFLMKMEYVFRCFQGRKDACLLWRPHPLLESTFDSMRKEYRPVYDRLKQCFIECDLGIYDDTPNLEETIAWSDAYIGDEGSSVTSLFGIAGKPVFILNNEITSIPDSNDLRKEIVKGISCVDGCDDKWIITQGNRLYYSPENNYRYEWYCDLSQYSFGNYYLGAYEINGRVYVCPVNAQEILVIENHRIIKRVMLKPCPIRTGLFHGVWIIDNYLFLIPLRYPAIVRYDTVRDKVDYLEGYHDIFIKHVQREWKVGGCCSWKNFLMLASPVDNKVLAVDSTTMKAEIICVGKEDTVGSAAMVLEKNLLERAASGDGAESGFGSTEEEAEIWLLPYTGYTVKRWNPETGAVRQYNDIPENLCGRNDRPFSWLTTFRDKAVLSPAFGNIFVALDKNTGMAEEWKLPERMAGERKDFINGMGTFFKITAFGEAIYRFYHAEESRLYEFDAKEDSLKEIPIIFPQEELEKHAPGFGKDSEWLVYACRENALNTLPDFLDGKICGNAFDRDRQKAEYREIMENSDGSCGEKVYQFVMKNK